MAVRSVPGRRWRRVAAGVLAAALLALAVPASHAAWSHVRAAGVLLRLAKPGPATESSWLAHPVDEVALELGGDGRSARARLYVPRDVADAPGLVLVHGVHWKGMDEPRLVGFARALASAGLRVLTPEVRELCDYRIEPSAVATIGAAASELRRRSGGRAPGVVGFSFAGGLSLLAAAEPRWQSSIRFVVAVGAHDDLRRVSRFFATDAIDTPDGGVVKMHAHDYGALVLVHAHPELFFAKEDAAPARDALRLWLHEDREAARARAAALSPEARAVVDALFARDLAPIAPRLLAAVEREGPAMDAVSPHARLGGVHVPVFLLHGAGDDVVPATESAWLAEGLGPAKVRAVLVSPAVQHVELQGKPTALDRFRIVHFMASLLDEAAAG